MLKEYLNNLLNKILNDKGHSFLYNEFDSIVRCIKDKNFQLSQEEITALENCLQTLIFESEAYLIYPQWSMRCHSCACELLQFIPAKGTVWELEYYRQRLIAQKEIYISRYPYLYLLTDDFKQYYEDIKKDYTKIAFLASVLFELSDSGRRPHTLSDEVIFYNFFLQGYYIAIEYINATHDYNMFTIWFKNLNPLHIEAIIENISDCSTSGRYDKESKMLNDTLDKQLKLLKIWINNNLDNFIEYWKSNGIISLLELIDDSHFYQVLKLLSSSNNCEVDKILDYYINDDEITVKEFAINLKRNRKKFT